MNRLLIFGFGALLLANAVPAFAADTTVSGGLDWFTMGMNLLGGLALFLFGMEMMSNALKTVAGDKMKTILGKFTKNRVFGMFTGAFVTAVIQSSSVTTVLLVGFVTAGLISLSQAVGVIIGANIGTTITAQIIAFKVTKYALIMVTIGFLMNFVGKKEKTKQYGLMFLGLGLVFFGMGMMSGAMKPLRTYEPFLQMMKEVENPLYGIVIAAAFTGLIQSSSATTGIILAMAMQGLITLEAGIALSLGANIGTCVTAGLASLGKPREAVRVAIVHITFNTVGALLVVGFIPMFSEFVRGISPVYPDLEGLDRLAKEAPRQIANAHTIFNVGAALFFLPLVRLLAWVAMRIVPAKKKDSADVEAPSQLLDDTAIEETPGIALDAAFREINQMERDVRAMLAAAVPAVASGNKEEMQKVSANDDRVDRRHAQLFVYFQKLANQSLSCGLSKRLTLAWRIADHVEHMGDSMEGGLLDIARKWEKDASMSKETQQRFQGLHKMVGDVLELTLQLVDKLTDSSVPQPEVQALARQVNEAKVRAKDANDEFKAYLRNQRSVSKDPHREMLYGLETKLAETLWQVVHHAKRVAEFVLGK